MAPDERPTAADSPELDHEHRDQRGVTCSERGSGASGEKVAEPAGRVQSTIEIDPTMVGRRPTRIDISIRIRIRIRIGIGNRHRQRQSAIGNRQSVSYPSAGSIGSRMAAREPAQVSQGV